MINSSSNFKEDTFGKDHDLQGASFPTGFMNSNPFINRGQLLDNSFPLDRGMIPSQST